MKMKVPSFVYVFKPQIINKTRRIKHTVDIHYIKFTVMEE